MKDIYRLFIVQFALALLGFALLACLSFIARSAVLIAVPNPPQQMQLDNFDKNTLQDFELDDIPIICATETNPIYKYLYNQYPGDWNNGPDPGIAEISTDTAKYGDKSLRVTVQFNGETGDPNSGNIYMQFRPVQCNGHTVNMWEFVEDTYTFDYYNRMRIWIKIAEGVTKLPDGKKNTAIGTYVRKQDADPLDQEDGGGHYYHEFNLQYTGEWHQLLWDFHPHARRGDSGGLDRGVLEYPTTTGAGWNAFDALNRWYIDINWRPPDPYPGVYYIDHIELFHDPNPENVLQIYSLHGTFVPSTNMLYVGWSRYKPEGTIDHEVRYAFSSVHSLGWANATPAPNGIVSPLGQGGYNGMEYETNLINVGTNDIIFVAIKPENSSDIREIRIPLK